MFKKYFKILLVLRHSIWNINVVINFILGISLLV